MRRFVIFGLSLFSHTAFGMSSSPGSGAAGGDVRVADRPTYQVDRVDGHGLLDDMYASTREEYMKISDNNLQGDKTAVQKLARHTVFTVITAWSAWQTNPASKQGMKKDAQDAGFFREYLNTLASWAHACHELVRKRRKKNPPMQMPWLLSEAPKSFFKSEEDYAQLAATEINGAETGSSEVMYKVLLFPLAHAQSGKSPFAQSPPQWGAHTAATGASMKTKVERVSRVMKHAEQLLFRDRDSPANGMEGQKKSGNDLQQCVEWLHAELPKRSKEAPKSNEMWWLFWHWGAGSRFFAHRGAVFLNHFQVERTDGSSALSKQERRKRRNQKGRGQTELQQQFRGALIVHAIGYAWRHVVVAVVPLTTLRARRHNHHLCYRLGAGEVGHHRRTLLDRVGDGQVGRSRGQQSDSGSSICQRTARGAQKQRARVRLLRRSQDAAGG
jgi:hypothetical protein